MKMTMRFRRQQSLVVTLFALLLPMLVAAQCQNDEQKAQIRKDHIHRTTIATQFSSVRTKIVFEYDRRGNLLSQVGYDEQDNPTLSWHYQYDSADRCTRAIANGTTTDYTFTLDDAGHVTGIEGRDGTTGAVRARTVGKVDAAGHVLSESHYDGQGKLTQVQETEYNSAGDPTKHVTKDGSGHVIETVTILYHAKGAASESSRYDGSGKLLSHTTYTYDPQLHLVEQKTTHPDNTWEKTTNTRNPQALVIKSVEERSSGSPTTTTYTYDLY